MLACSLIALLLLAGCADIKATQKVGDFGTAFGASSEEQKAIDWFKATYGDPLSNNDQPARFVEPLVTSGLSEKNLPIDKVTTFPVSGGSVYFFVIYDNFRKGDPITVSWVYLENGKEVTSVQQQAGGDFGRFIVEFQKPDTGWGKGRQRITVSGSGATASVEFAIGDTLGTGSLPYTGGSGGGGIPISGSVPTGTPTSTRTFDPHDPNNKLPTFNPDATFKPISTIQHPRLTSCWNGSANILVDLDTDVKHCGACRAGCYLANADNGCSGGKCYVKSCFIGFADCNKMSSDGCEVDLDSDNSNCGQCGRIPSLPNANAICCGEDGNGKFCVEYCLNGWTNDNGLDQDGCEVPPK